jgi:hypothetical protein
MRFDFDSATRQQPRFDSGLGLILGRRPSIRTTSSGRPKQAGLRASWRIVAGAQPGPRRRAGARGPSAPTTPLPLRSPGPVAAPSPKQHAEVDAVDGAVAVEVADDRGHGLDERNAASACHAQLAVSAAGGQHGRLRLAGVVRAPHDDRAVAAPPDHMSGGCCPCAPRCRRVRGRRRHIAARRTCVAPAP